MLLKQRSTFNNNNNSIKTTSIPTTQQIINVSTDAMSLDGLLDSVSSGSFSGPASPQSKTSCYTTCKSTLVYYPYSFIILTLINTTCFVLFIHTYLNKKKHIQIKNDDTDGNF